MFKPYEDLESWSQEELEEELENLHLDKRNGTMSDDMYQDCYAIILDELLKREDDELLQEAYERAMKGI